MARSPAAANGGWPPPRHPAEPDPRAPRAAPQGQRPAPPAGYPQASYPDQPGYDPQGYHYPQNGQAMPAPVNPRQALSSLDPAQSSEYPPYPTNQPPYGQPQQSRGYGQAPAPFGAPGAMPGQDPRMAAAGYEQWPMAPAQDPHGGYDLGGYMPTGAPQHPGGMPLHAEPHDPLQQQAEWGHPAELGYGDGGPRDAFGGAQMGYEPVHGGALEQAYAQDEAGDYEVEEPRRGSWAMRIAGAIVVAIGLGYGLAQGYKLIANAGPDGTPPVVRGDSAPARTKPADPGGKQFAHTDTKIMDRLGDNPSGGEPSAPASDADVDGSGARKVQTLVIGRDGSIASPPAAAPPEQPVTTGAVSMPGVTMVDGFGGYPQAAPSAAPAVPEQAPPAEARKPVVVKPPASDEKPVVVAKATPPQASETATDESPAPAEPKKTAAVAPPSSGANGYVVVLASVPASGASRLTALKKFADMQQQYGSVLQNKTPDVQEANLGEKGVYHRLVVGPPGSRAQASTLCTDLKSAGYKDCWVMAY